MTPAREGVASTPRVIGIVLSDMALASEIGEADAVTLENVREWAAFPRFDPVHVYLQLYFWPGGTFTGEAQLRYDGRLCGLRRFRATIEAGGRIVGLWIGELGPFDAPGRYAVEVAFWYEPLGHYILKGERTFDLIAEEQT